MYNGPCSACGQIIETKSVYQNDKLCVHCHYFVWKPKVKEVEYECLLHWNDEEIPVIQKAFKDCFIKVGDRTYANRYKNLSTVQILQDSPRQKRYGFRVYSKTIAPQR